MTQTAVVTSSVTILEAVDAEASENIASVTKVDICPDCGSNFVQHIGGCKMCIICGWSACSL